MKKKKGVLLAAILVIIVTGSVLLSVPASALTLRWADMSPATGERPKYLMKAAAEIEKATEGRVKIQFYWSNSLVKVKENVRAVQKGVADMAWTSPSYHPAEYPITDVSTNVLYAPKGDDAEFMSKAYWAMWDEYKPFRDDIEKWGQTVWYLFPYPSYGCFAKKPIHKPEDLKGMRLRVTSESVGKIVSAVGAHPGFYPASEVYTALEKNMVDGAICGYEWGKRYNLYEVTKYLNLLNACSASTGFGVVSFAALNKMSEADRKAFMEIGRKVSLEYARAMNESRKGDIQFVKDKGMTLVPFPEAERARWAAMPEVKVLLTEWLEKHAKAGRGEEARGMMKIWLEKFELSHLMPK